MTWNRDRLVFYNSPELIWVVFAAMFYANVSILFIGLIETKTILQLLRIPFHYLAPMILCWPALVPILAGVWF